MLPTCLPRISNPVFGDFRRLMVDQGSYACAKMKLHLDFFLLKLIDYFFSFLLTSNLT